MPTPAYKSGITTYLNNNLSYVIILNADTVDFMYNIDDHITNTYKYYQHFLHYHFDCLSDNLDVTSKFGKGGMFF